MVRDFTYIDDVVESIVKLIDIDYRDKNLTIIMKFLILVQENQLS